MTDLTQAGRQYERSLELMNEWIEEHEEAIIARGDQIAEQMVRDRTPTAERAMRELLASDEFDGELLELLHSFLWDHHVVAVKKAREVKARLLDLAAMECNVQAEARAQAEKEIDHNGDEP